MSNNSAQKIVAIVLIVAATVLVLWVLGMWMMPSMMGGMMGSMSGCMGLCTFGPLLLAAGHSCGCIASAYALIQFT